MVISEIRKALPIIFFGLFFLSFIGINYSVYNIILQNPLLSLIISLLTTGIIIGSRLIKTTYDKIAHYIRNIVNFYVGALFIFFIFSMVFRVIVLAGLTFNVYYYLLVSGMATLFAMHSSQDIIRKTYIIPSTKVKKESTIIHISDIHVGSNSKHALKKVVDMVNLIKTDYVFITGDLVDEDITYEDISYLNNLKIKPYFIYGNHEHYVNQKNLSSIIKKLNIKTLFDESVINKEFQIIGIDDKSNLSTTLSSIPVKKDKFSILLNHQPSLIDFVESRGIDLMLSGHTHGGQIWPFNYLVRLQFKYVSGFYKIKELYLNVSPGTGTWGPRMRLGTTSEISIITIKPQ